MVIESLISVITDIITHLKLFVRYFFAETHKESSSDKKKFKYFESLCKLHPNHILVARSSVNQPCRFVGLFICIWSASSRAVRLFRMLPPLVCFYLFKYYSFSFHICKWDKTLQTHHVYSTLKRRGKVCFYFVSTCNTRGVFGGKLPDTKNILQIWF